MSRENSVGEIYWNITSNLISIVFGSINSIFPYFLIQINKIKDHVDIHSLHIGSVYFYYITNPWVKKT